MGSPVIVVEDGTNVAGSNSYISQVNAVNYFTNNGDQVWANATSDAQASALIRACGGMNQWLNGRWLGRRANQNQSLDWPRCGVCDSDGYLVPNNQIPTKLQYAQAEVARIELTTPFIQNSVNASNALKSQKIGPITLDYKDTAPSITYWPKVIAMLTDFAQIGLVPITVTIGLSRREQERLRRGEREGFLNPFDYGGWFQLIKEPIYNPGLPANWYDAPWLI